MTKLTPPGAATAGPYEPREFDLTAVTGLSQRAIELHLELYQGYVKEFNTLLAEQSAGFPAPGEAASPLDLASHARRFAFEYNGIVLHELFFEALGAPGATAPDKQGVLADAAERSFGGLEQWMQHAAALAKLRGVGWVVAVRERDSNRIYNCWVDLHHLATPANTDVVLALDLWEHAYLLDFAPSQRTNYFEMLWNSVDWARVEARCGQ
ncbi:MAG TPA: Fe-Mn family superoxide dismutase [Steroidobacteraceae bacterium]